MLLSFDLLHLLVNQLLSMHQLLLHTFEVFFQNFQPLLMLLYLNLSLMNQLHFFLNDLIQRLVLIIGVLWEILILVVVVDLLVLR